ncbi:hypothetical protein [Novosphingobium arvoryzae]|uniref:Uncharacterized protein n=1 Tax=Novosphingobium arvoryzae TaxID=1256514 RepID=A0A918RPX7_9SPHN|nr:hypothetical protein [Novosphingobium arvoryzae]GHA07758.1 hypothetical protein GCM10011617_30540 [Novosphingobium arvoryzae]
MVEAAEWDEGIRKAYEHKRFPEAPPRYRGLAYPWRERVEVDSEHAWRNSVYYFWWEYMRRNERYRLIHDVMNSAWDSELRKEHSDSITAQEIELYGLFGNVFDPDFHAWWRTHYQLFSDEVSAFVKVIEGRAADGKELCSFPFADVHKLTIADVVRKAQGYFGDQNCVVVEHRRSRAKFRTVQRYVLPNLKTYLDVWDLRKSEPEMEDHEIADALKLSVNETVDGETAEELRKMDLPHADIAKAVRRRKRLVVQRNLRIAQQYIDNVMLGQFPWRTKR